MEFGDVVRLRRSTRHYTDEQISDEELQTILDAGQLAPIAGGDYTMSHFTVVQSHELIAEIREASHFTTKSGKKIDATRGVPTIIFVSVTGPSDDDIEYCNVGCAIENMTLAATNLGLGSCYLWGFLKKLRKHPDVIAKLGLPEGYTVLSCLGVGHATTPLEKREPKENIKVDYIR